MSLPESVRVGSAVYAVKRKPRLKAQNKELLNGSIDYETCTITIDTKLPPELAERVLWHEVMHAIAEEYNVKHLSDDAIDSLSHGVLSVLHNNPSMREVL